MLRGAGTGSTHSSRGWVAHIGAGIIFTAPATCDIILRRGYQNIVARCVSTARVTVCAGTVRIEYGRRTARVDIDIDRTRDARGDVINLCIERPRTCAAARSIVCVRLPLIVHATRGDIIMGVAFRARHRCATTSRAFCGDFIVRRTARTGRTTHLRYFQPL